MALGSVPDRVKQCFCQAEKLPCFWLTSENKSELPNAMHNVNRQLQCEYANHTMKELTKLILAADNRMSREICLEGKGSYDSKGVIET